MSVAGTIKVVLNGVLGVIVFHDPLTVTGAFGSALAVLGVYVYNYLNAVEKMKAAGAPLSQRA